MVNLRGVIGSNVDFRIKFDLGEPKYDEFTVVIILSIAGCIAVDSVSDVLVIGTEQIEAAPEFNVMLDASYFTRLGSVRPAGVWRMLILADIEQLMGASGVRLVGAATQIH